MKCKQHLLKQRERSLKNPRWQSLKNRELGGVLGSAVENKNESGAEATRRDSGDYLGTQEKERGEGERERERGRGGLTNEMPRGVK